MNTEFRKAVFSKEIRSLTAFDRKAFHPYPADWFGRDDWQHYECWWMIAGNRKVGCCAFELHVDFQEDIHPRESNPLLRGSLYIVTTGVLPALQGQGFGSLLKSWQILYARRHGFSRIITNTRQGNIAMIHLNEKFGFTTIRTTPNYYERPREATVVMELRLS